MLKSGAMTEIDNLDKFLSYGFDLTDTLVQEIDFRDAEIPWDKYICKNTFFIGCKFSKQATVGLIFEKGGFAFPKFNDLPYNAYRSCLYSPLELMEGYDPKNDRSLDRRIYDHFVAKGRHSPDIAEALSQRIHDHAIDEALDDLLETRQAKVIGIMGGHGCKRDSIYYAKIAKLARMLTLDEYFIASGGGPGIMEAANLGAYFANYSEDQLFEAIDMMQGALHYSDKNHISESMKVVEKFPDGAESIAVPTWFYGHEPSNLFSMHIAKYFSNGIREDRLLAIALHGVVFAPGSAGTTQEIFMDATQNHYGSYGWYSPMVFIGPERYKIETLIYPLLDQLAWGKTYGSLLKLTDSSEEALEFIKSHPPVRV